MKNTPYIEWDDENKVATCVLYYKNKVFYGMATCHPDDMDFANEYTGEHIAYLRAMIEALNWERDCEIKPALAALKQVYYSMNHSKKYNPKSYEAKMLRRQIRSLENELAAVNADLAAERTSLSEYLKAKDRLYTKLRAKNQ